MTGSTDLDTGGRQLATKIYFFSVTCETRTSGGFSQGIQGIYRTDGRKAAPVAGLWGVRIIKNARRSGRRLVVLNPNSAGVLELKAAIAADNEEMRLDSLPSVSYLPALADIPLSASSVALA